MKRKVLRECDVPCLFAFYHDIGWRTEAGEELNDRYQELLGNFTEDASGFREMMRRTNCIISGSVALWFLMGSPKEWTPNDMDILVPQDTFLDVVQFLEGLDGAGPHDFVIPPDWPYPVEAYTARATIHTPRGRFDVLQSARESPLFPIPFYWSTHLMNALTSDALYCAYPALTLIRQGVYPGHEGQHIGGMAVEKHLARGFAVHYDRTEVGDGSAGCLGFVVCSRKQRFFGDDRTFVVPLGKGTVGDSVLWLGRVGTAAWRLGGKGCGNARCLQPTSFAAGILNFEDVE